MSIKTNYIYNVTYQILLLITPLITTPYISRVLGAELIGIHSYCYSIATYFVLFIMLGVANYGNRSTARSRNDKKELSKMFSSIYATQMIRGVIVSILYYLYVLFFVSSYKTIALVNGIYVISAVFDISWFFFGLEQFKLTVTRNIVIKILSVISIILFVNDDSDLVLYSLIIVLSAFITNIYLWIFVFKHVSVFRVSWSDMSKHIIPELLLFIPIIAVSLYKILDKIMLGLMTTPDEVGFFTSSESIVSIPLSIVTALGPVMLPRISYLIANGEVEESQRYIGVSIQFSVMLSSAFAFGLVAISTNFVPVFFGDGFDPCIVLLKGMPFTIILISWANVIRTQYLIPNDADKEYIVSVVIGAFINVLMNLLLIRQLGSIGAMLSTITAESVVCIIQTKAVWGLLPIKEYIRDSIKYIIFGLIMAAGVSYIPQIIGNGLSALICQLFVGGLIYSALVCIILYKSKDNALVEIIRVVTKRGNK